MYRADQLANLPPELLAYIREQEGRASALQQRVAFLEDQFRLAQLKRFAPSSEIQDANARLKKLVAELGPDKAILPDVASEKWNGRR